MATYRTSSPLVAVYWAFIVCDIVSCSRGAAHENRAAPDRGSPPADHVMLQTTLEGTAAAAASAAAASSAATASHGQALLQKTLGKARIVLADGPEEFVGNSIAECIAAGDSIPAALNARAAPTQATSRLQQRTVVKKVVLDLDEDSDSDGPEEFVGISLEECIADGDSIPAALNARVAATQGTSRLQQGTAVKKVVFDLDEDSE